MQSSHIDEIFSCLLVVVPNMAIISVLGQARHLLPTCLYQCFKNSFETDIRRSTGTLSGLDFVKYSSVFGCILFSCSYWPRADFPPAVTAFVSSAISAMTLTGKGDHDFELC